MFRYLFELVSALFVFGLIRSVVSAISRSVSHGGTIPNPAYRNSRQAESGSAGAGEMRTLGELRKDPVCGTFVAMNTPYTHIKEGTTTYFCSKECRDRYKSGRKAQDPWQKSTAARS